jgi:hypothetical protein
MPMHRSIVRTSVEGFNAVYRTVYALVSFHLYKEEGFTCNLFIYEGILGIYIHLVKFRYHMEKVIPLYKYDHQKKS